jgi:hypothetical protein
MINNTLRSTNNAMNKGMNIGSLIRTPGNNRV